MKRIYIYLTVMATLLIGGGKAMAQSVTIDGVVYSVSGDHAYVSGNNGVGDTVVVLGTVTINDVEYPVTEIGYRAFYRLTQVLSYTLPDGIISIGTEAFYDNYVLKTINLPSSIESIGHMAFGYNWDVQITELPANLTTLDTEAFRGCTSATFTKIPQGITHIPIGAFRGCSSLTSLEFPEGLTQIDNYAFEGCTALTTINIPAEAVITYVGTDAFRNTQVVLPEENSIRYLGSVAYELTDRSLTEYVIKEGTTAIYSNLFDGCTNMTSITIPSSVVSIGEYAFSGCTSLPIENGIRYADCYAIEVTDKTLTEYSLKNNVRFLGNALFQDCSAMTSVNIPLGVIAISNNTFSGCSALTSLTLPESVTSIGGSAFANCSSLTSVNIPSGVTSISANTFTGCSSLTSVVLPDSITSIGASAFANCSSLTSLILPETVTSIGNQAFYLCISLASINIPSGVPTIGESTFYQCSSLTSMTLPASVTSIGNQAFCHCGELSTLTLSKKLTSIGTQAFQYCNKLQKIINYSNLQLTKGNTGYGYVACYAQQIINADAIVDDYYYFDTDSNGKHHLVYYEGTDSILTLPSDYQGGSYGIGDNAFSGQTQIVSIQLPEELEFIGANAFNGCSSLTSINVPSGITAIGSYAFYDCSSLTIDMPEKISAIGDYAFYNCSSLTSLAFKEGPTTIGRYAFYNCTSLSSIEILSGVNEIQGYAFHNCQALESVKLPEGLTTIREAAFYICPALKTVNIPESVTIIEHSALKGCSSLDSITIPQNLTVINQHIFENCVSLSSITLPKQLNEIKYDAFRNCTSLKKIFNYSDLQLTKGSSNHGYVAQYAQQVINVDTIIGDFWFDTDANGEHYLTYYEGMDSILILPSDYLEGSYGIGDAVFSGHSEIVSIQLPNGVESIGANAFNGCSALTSLTLPESVTSVGSSAFSNCSSLTSVIIPEGLTSIGDNTFYGCSSLTSLTLPESVTSIGAEAFYDCSSLASVNIPSGVSKIDTRTFYGCAALSSMTIPASVTSIGNQAFVGCTGIKDLTLADGRKTLSLDQNGYGSYTGQFTPCSKLETLYLGRNLNYNTDGYYGGYSPFYNIPTLKEVVVGDSVTAIGINAFHSCGNLTSISLPASVTSIGSSAFSGCGSLTYVRCGFESPQVLYGKDLREKAVIYVPKGTYVAYKETFPNNIIVDGEANEVTVDITIPGTLGEEVLNQVAYLRGVHSLKVSGTLNDDDISTITESMVNLIHLDLSKTSLTSVNGIGHANLCSIVFPDSCKSLSGYSERDNLTSITLPDAVETLGDNCFYGCDQLTEVTMPANLKTVGAYAFRYCRKLKEITFKDGLVLVGNEAFYDCSNLKSVFFGAGDKTIGHQAFWNCNSLESVSFGDGVASITGSHPFYSCDKLRILIVGDGISTSTNNSSYPAFKECYNISEIHIPNIEAWLNSSFSNIQSTPNYYSSNVNLYIDGELLTDVVIPSSVTSIRPYAFGNIKGITSVTIPEGMKTISSEAFYNCDNLASVVIPEGVTTIQSNAFAQCDSLRSITLPSTLNNCAAGAFTGSGLVEVTCPAFFPPVTGGDMIGANNCTLYVPEWTLNRYKLANNWNLFAAIEPISGIYPAGISVYTVESLVIPAEGLAEGYKPNLEIIRYDDSNVGRLTLRGEKAMPLSTFKMEQTRATGTMTSLVNYGTLTADSVVTQVNFSTNTWHYLTFPYDVKISDIATLGDWVIRRYDGASRARADFSSTWQNVPYDSILHAGEGYIWYSTNGNFTVPAIENDNRNLIFANETRYTQLKEHASATEANYGWNLIGNPYPCFYDTRFIEYGSPITVRSGNSYAAYSPVDDSYILSPLEAFFVQCSADNNVVAFDAEGRQNDKTVRTLTSAPKRTRAVNNDRSVFNLYLENGSYTDHTRFVINESASLAYEIACDAAKFMSDDPAVQQLFTIEGEERMAINERPFANGEVALGTYFGKSGNYTIALDTRVTEMEVVLVDKFTGAETDLMTDSYTFTTEAGTFTDRFAIRMKRTGVVDAIEAATAAKVQVTALTGAISIMNAAAPISIYNAAGALVTTMDGGDVTVEVAPGMYIVKVGDEIHKVSVIK